MGNIDVVCLHASTFLRDFAVFLLLFPHLHHTFRQHVCLRQLPLAVSGLRACARQTPN